jgi:hypothetical protein
MLLSMNIMFTSNPRCHLMGGFAFLTNLFEVSERVVESGGEGRWSRAPPSRQKSKRNERIQSLAVKIKMKKDELYTHKQPQCHLLSWFAFFTNLFEASDH